MSIPHSFASLLADALQQTLSSQPGVATRVTAQAAAEASTDTAAETGQRLRVEMTGQLSGELHFTFSDNLQRALPAPSSGEASSAQALRALLALARPHVDESFHDYQLLFAEMTEDSGPPPKGCTALGQFTFTPADSAGAVVGFYGDPALVACLQGHGLHPSLGSHALTRPPSPAEHLQRVIDVPLAVTLRFGQRQLTLREVLELNTGSLVELDQQVEEPVQLMLGDRVIARGEVVIVDGNYGMRVTEVVESSRQRIPSLA